MRGLRGVHDEGTSDRNNLVAGSASELMPCRAAERTLPHLSIVRSDCCSYRLPMGSVVSATVGVWGKRV